MKTRISGRWVVGHRGGHHRIVPDGEVVYEDGVVEYVGRDYEGAVNREIDATDHLVTPGFVNLHCVATVDPGVFVIDRESPDPPNSEVLRQGSDEGPDQRLVRASARHAVAGALSSGSTTVGAVTTTWTNQREGSRYAAPTVAAAMEELGVRGYVAHPFRSRGHLDSDGCRRDDETDRAGLDRAVEFAETVQRTGPDRLAPYLFPHGLDSCSPDLLRAAKGEADRLGIHLLTRFAQSLDEIESVRERHGTSPVRYLDDLGVLDRNLILAHGGYAAGEEGTPTPDGAELDLLADREVAVAHDPLAAARRGVFLDSFSRYQNHGVTTSIGTGTFPQDVVSLLRWGAASGKAVERRADTATARELFDAATLGGARALGRPDIGKLAPGARADVVCIDFSRSHVGYVTDPIRTLLYNCYGTDVDRVVVGGDTQVADGSPVGVDSETLAEDAQTAFDEAGTALAERDDAADTTTDPLGRSFRHADPDDGGADG